LEEIEVLNSGENYDIVNPPTLSITDISGSGCDAYGNFSGNVSEIIVNNRGFDYAKIPSVTISGGNGSGAVCEAKMRGFTHKASFTDFDVSLAADTFNGEHKFLRLLVDILIISIGMSGINDKIKHAKIFI